MLRAQLESEQKDCKAKIKEFQQEISAIKNKVASRENELKDAQQKLQNLKLEKQNLSRVRKDLEVKEKLEKDLEICEKQKLEIQDKIKKLEEELKKYSNIEEEKLWILNAENLLEKIRTKDKISEDINNVNEMLNTLNFSKEEFEKLKEEINGLKSSIEKLSSELNLQKELLEQTKKTISALEKTKAEILEMEKEILTGKELLEELQIFTNALKYTQFNLRKYLIDNINLAMEAIWNKLYPYEDLIAAKVEIVNGDYEILVKDAYGRWLRAEGLLSGGERSAAALTLRIALSLVLTQHLSWLILDEPTHNLDSTAVKTFADMLRDHLPNLVDQIFVITHDKELEKAATGSLYFLERDKNKGGVSKPVLQQLEP
ncbi:MAG: hypothetical protein DRO04_02665 [Candidatus Iainarchaeum archaeon]|uniref:ATPase AAA-type core domain-containing protein n=1 Tax=Candidatus Iainarchaeum sp. TaxID=3101447 RepID=A0A497JFZ7_9ARCH|nr:MAG: hypothetical protein DRO04_02665 [Candidatus Diapherotrites archaeon]